jgi:glycerol-3-phosphate dehydrogenase (NAD(P)+)
MSISIETGSEIVKIFRPKNPAEKRITVVGAGSWGTALGLVLDQNGHEITVWGHNAERLLEMRRMACNQTYLPGVSLPPQWRYDADLLSAVASSDALVMAVPSTTLRGVAEKLAGYRGVVISVTKGIEPGTGLTMTGILREMIPGVRAVALSGPTLAPEVAGGRPCAAVAAHLDAALAGAVQDWFHRPTFRVYTSADPLGVELGGALKNVIAIGAGVCDGLGLGDNAKAALITRGIAEISRIGVAGRAELETFSGLSGLGDLVVTCFSKLSRNRGLGERLGRGEKLEQILAKTLSVAEGYPTADSACQLARRLGVETPIIDQVRGMLYEGKDVRQAIQELMSRDHKPERS